MVVNDYDVLFNHPNPDGNGKDYKEYLNKDSHIIHNGYFEPSVCDLKIGETVQMIRRGYYTLDTDGKSLNKTVSLKEIKV